MMLLEGPLSPAKLLEDHCPQLALQAQVWYVSVLEAEMAKMCW